MLTWLAFAGIPAATLLAQFDPFGGASPPPAATKPGTAPAAAKAPSDANEHPVVLAIRESNPTTPSQLIRALRAMMNIDRPDEAKKYLTKLIAAKPDATTQTALLKEFDSAFFVRLMRYEPLAPEGPQFARAVIDAAYQAARDPNRLKQLVRDLSDPSTSVRQTAFRDLYDAEIAALPPLIEALADSSRTAEHPQIQDALVALGDSSVEPLIGALGSGDESVSARAAVVLGRLQARRAALYLVRPYLSDSTGAELRDAAQQALRQITGEAPSKYDGLEYLRRRAQSYYAGTYPREPDVTGQIELWQWDPSQKTVVPRKYVADAAAHIEAARVASELNALAPDNTDYRRLYLSALLESAKHNAGLDQPLPAGPNSARATAAAYGPQVIEDVLARAIEEKHIPAATAAAEVLADIGDVGLLVADGGRERPLSLALGHRDRRLRMAAVQTILKLDPQRGFPGASRVPEVLGYFIRSIGERRALIGHPNVEEAQTLVGMLNEMGIDAMAASRGSEVFKLAAASPDIEFILLSDAIDFPDANETRQMLRRDARTAKLPIGLIARQEHLARARRIAGLDRLTETFPWPYDAASLSYDVGRMFSSAGYDVVSYQERIAQAKSAIEALAKLTENAHQYPFYDLLRQQSAVIAALYTPELSGPAATVLGRIGSPAAQRALVNYASQSVLPLAQRQAAAAAFDVAARQRGTLLTTDEIRRQYDRYNQSATLDAETQQVLGSLLDTIELPLRRAAMEKMKDEG